MKNLFLNLITMLCLIILTSCEGPPKTNADYEKIIGTPIKFGNLEVTQYRFPEYLNWDVAKKICEDLGNGWRLPTNDELNTLYKNKNKIPGFTQGEFWSSTEGDDGFAWFQEFFYGTRSLSVKSSSNYARAVRDLTSSNTVPTSKTVPTSNTDYENIIGIPIKIGNIEVAEYDFPKGMNWNDAKKVCSELGDGWRIPSKKELNTLYQNMVKIRGFDRETYWSSTEGDDGYAWVQEFSGGNQYSTHKDFPSQVRVIRNSTSSNTEPTSKTDYENIIGIPIKIGNIEVAEYDFPKGMNWNDAKKVCSELGDGWRLPSMDELNTLYQNKVKIRGFADANYWSSTEFGLNVARVQDFTNGGQNYGTKDYTYYVRAIRVF